MKKLFLSLLVIFFLATLSAQQNTFQKEYGRMGFEMLRSVKQTSDSGYIMTGETDEYFIGNFDLWVLKTNANGDTLWSDGIGGTDDDRGFSVQVIPGNGSIIQGYTKSFGAG